MFSAVIALVGALVYGSADFLGGLAARRLKAVVVTATAAGSGLLLLLIAAPFFGGTWNREDVIWGALSGIAGAAAIGLLYACLAIGPMSILSPLTAVVAAIAPMMWGLLVDGESLASVGYVGLALAVVAVVLVGFVPGQKTVRPSALGVAMATGSGLSIGAFLILINQTADSSGLIPLVMNRAVNAAITGSIVGVLMLVALRRGQSPTAPLRPHRAGTVRRAWLLAIACGVTDAVANVLLLVALRDGQLSIVSALTALYPAGTILLAALVLRERIALVQGLGLALAVAAGALLAIA
ncbi:putative membrane protein [Microbacterium endophyticum]|uniref:Putative membrane protein n=1 Tax=Microbacterium endophyticum TaxID=1526412 RepID=A0A7W4V1G7_9MICO|nr:EamA family transporter [Microbacterium endophyticum]MBB2975072.1 putative membrane protein [Microbacterium endophyticum]NIK37388.1 putative membrane protein [Microbacterium endophyticum]